jgi:hypothetical protein
MAAKITKKDVRRLVRETIEECLNEAELNLKFKLEDFEKDEAYWYIAVVVDEYPEGRSRYRYHDALSDAELKLRERKKLSVVLVPAIP